MAKSSKGKSSKGVTVFTVLFDGQGDEGPMCDGALIRRFKREIDAKAFARGKTAYGRPAEVQVEDDVPCHLATRWGVLCLTVGGGGLFIRSR